jgi:predicted GNAT family N-acyltransferase
MIKVVQVSDDASFDHVFAIRRKVFVEEQNVPEEEEWDEFEHLSKHYLATYEGKPVGTARWRVTLNGDIKLERFAVLKEVRGKNVGASLVQMLLNEVPIREGVKIYLHAQLSAKDFYAKYGFIPEGEIFSECDILHVKMVYKS